MAAKLDVWQEEAVAAFFGALHPLDRAVLFEHLLARYCPLCGRERAGSGCASGAAHVPPPRHHVLSEMLG